LNKKNNTLFMISKKYTIKRNIYYKNFDKKCLKIT
jgi:hypothetical protein